jgi:catechol-2,3-dioxygenase
MSKFPDFEISHIGFHVFDLEKMVRFYTETFGFVISDRGVVHGNTSVVFLSRSAKDHHQIVLAGGRAAEQGVVFLNQISLRVATLSELRTVYESIVAERGTEGVRSISHGNAYSVYFPDPEGNNIEVFTDSPWYVEQPVLDPFDFTKSDEEILASTLKNIEGKPGFKKFSEWSDEMQRRLDKY